MDFNLDVFDVAPTEEQIYTHKLFSDPAEVAKEKGLLCVEPKANELFIDVDTEEQYKKFLDLVNIFNEHEDITYKVAPSKSGLPHRHITASLSFPIDHWQRQALQAALGSDTTRELLSCIRVLNNHTKPSVFFEQETRP